jgi:hypothetical protein
MKDRQKIERDYREIRANIQSGVERIPYTYGKLPLEAQARLNRLVISGGLMFVYWDSLAKQKELAEIFVPLKTAARVQTSYEASHRGRTIRSIHETLDEKGIPYYPEQSADERYAGTVLRVLIKATHRLKGTSTLRVLPRGELMDLKKLHGLSRNSDEFESNTAQIS